MSVQVNHREAEQSSGDAPGIRSRATGRQGWHPILEGDLGLGASAKLSPPVSTGGNPCWSGKQDVELPGLTHGSSVSSDLQSLGRTQQEGK